MTGRSSSREERLPKEFQPAKKHLALPCRAAWLGVINSVVPTRNRVEERTETRHVEAGVRRNKPVQEGMG